MDPATADWNSLPSHVRLPQASYEPIASFIERYRISGVAGRPTFVTLRAGEVLFLPALWYHRVSQGEDKEGRTIAINMWCGARLFDCARLLNVWFTVQVRHGVQFAGLGVSPVYARGYQAEERRQNRYTVHRLSETRG